MARRTEAAQKPEWSPTNLSCVSYLEVLLRHQDAGHLGIFHLPHLPQSLQLPFLLWHFNNAIWVCHCWLSLPSLEADNQELDILC